MPGYRDSSLVAGDEQDLEVLRAAREHGSHVCMACAERFDGRLHMGQMLISPEGEPLIVCRKLKPTLAERSAFGEGNGTHPKVVETEIGRLGALKGWEHLQPLLKCAMYAPYDAIGIAKTTAGPAGHYARPDVTRLVLSTVPARRVVPMDEFVHAGSSTGAGRACRPADDGCNGDECACSDPGQV